MSSDRRQKAAKRMRALGVGLDSQDDTAIPAPCPFQPGQCDRRDNTIRVNLPALSYRCNSCNQSGAIEAVLDALEALSTALIEADHAPESLPVAERAPREPSVPIQAELIEPEAPLVLAEAQLIKRRPAVSQPVRRGGAERFIITVLALVFLCAGLAAAGLSGFANYRAFWESVADPLQSRIWGWTGVIASVVSFGGFTFFYWHMANRRRKEGVRALLFALAGVGTSIVGTQMYLANNAALSAGEISQAASNRSVMETQIADWRVQLDGIPADTRSVEGLEIYLAEVERVGRSHQKPYRDAQNELGLARRRDALQSKIDAANAELLGIGETGIVVSASERPAPPGWFFAIMLEIFSSQGTSIGLVALLILYARRP